MTDRRVEWASTMRGNVEAEGVVVAHPDASRLQISPQSVTREQRELAEDLTMVAGATRAVGAGNRAAAEVADPFRTCFERDRDRILHASAFRRLAGKTQVFVFPDDHQRTRLTHALEVAQVATSISRALGLNVALTEAIALGHDCGHGPGGHASEDAFDLFIPEGYHHAVWGADVALASLNLCVETLDGIRNHSWSRPTPATPEGEVVSWADRFAYCAADLDDAVCAHIVSPDELPSSVTSVLGRSQSSQLRSLITALVTSTNDRGMICLGTSHAEALADLRAFNYERVYNRPDSVAQAESVVEVLQALVNFFVAEPGLIDGFSADEPDITRAVVSYVAGMTDRFAFGTAVALLDWPLDRLPVGIDSPRGAPSWTPPAVGRTWTDVAGPAPT